MTKTQIKKTLDALKQSLLEAGRLVLTAGVSYLLTEGVLGVLVDHFFGVRIDAAIKLQVVTGVTVLLKSVDRALHESGINKKGLTQF